VKDIPMAKAVEMQTAVQPPPPGRGLANAALAVAAACGLLALGVAAVLLWSFRSEGGLTELASPQMTDLRAQLASALSNSAVTAEQRESLMRQIRAEDARLRSEYFGNRHRRQIGGYVLLSFLGLGLLAMAGRRMLLSQARPAKLPLVAQRTRREPAWAPMLGVCGVAAAAAVAVAALFVAGALAQSGMPPADWSAQLAAGEQAATQPTATQPAVAFHDNWPRFRGAGGQGIVPVADRSYPDQWDIESGKNIKWKVPVGIAGKSSPILWGDRVFLTGGDERRRQVLCFDRATGKQRWAANIRTPAGVKLEVDDQPLQIFEDTGWAAPTPVTDGKLVYAIFASGDVAAVDFDGNVKWTVNIGVPDSAYGFASSPVLFAGQLIIQFDQGTAPEDNKSELVALDTADGSRLWSDARPVGGSWSSPAVFKTPSGDQLVTCANPWVIAYDPKLGTEIWRAEVLGGSVDVAASPVYADGVVYVTNDQAVLAAIKTNGSDNVTETHVLWKAENGMPDIASPLTDGRRVLQARSDGQLTCFKAADGKELWDHSADDGFQASPSLVGELVYLPDNIGNTLLFRLADEFKLIRKNDLGEPIAATPAFGDNCIYLRGTKHLFCVGRKP
jgi:outer membrane protein assembly factor BamB